jgi:hypothetical protein
LIPSYLALVDGLDEARGGEESSAGRDGLVQLDILLAVQQAALKPPYANTSRVRQAARQEKQRGACLYMRMLILMNACVSVSVCPGLRLVSLSLSLCVSTYKVEAGQEVAEWDGHLATERRNNRERW